MNLVNNNLIRRIQTDKKIMENMSKQLRAETFSKLGQPCRSLIRDPFPCKEISFFFPMKKYK